MGELAYVHIVDADAKRRNLIARHLYGGCFHPEVYESATELLHRPPTQGALLVNDDPDTLTDLASVAALRESTRFLPLAFFSEQPTPERIVGAIHAGVTDYFSWPVEREYLMAALGRLLSEGERRAKNELDRLDARSRVGNLSPRQLDVLRLLIGGATNRYIAKQLGISPRTVEIHRGKMMEALSVSNIADVVRIGLLAFWDD